MRDRVLGMGRSRRSRPESSRDRVKWRPGHPAAPVGAAVERKTMRAHRRGGLDHIARHRSKALQWYNAIGYPSGGRPWSRTRRRWLRTLRAGSQQHPVPGRAGAARGPQRATLPWVVAPARCSDPARQGGPGDVAVGRTVSVWQHPGDVRHQPRRSCTRSGWSPQPYQTVAQSLQRRRAAGRTSRRVPGPRSVSIMKRVRSNLA